MVSGDGNMIVIGSINGLLQVCSVDGFMIMTHVHVHVQ